MSPYADMFGGAVAGVSGTLIGYPLDTIKTRMQTTSSVGMFETGAAVLKREGAKGFYKGVAAPLLSLTVLSTLNFTVFTNLHHSLSSSLPPSSSPSLPTLLAGAACGPIAAVFSTPEHYIKTQMQVDNSRASPRFTGGSLAAASSIARSRGWGALYTGAASNTARETVFLSTYFLSYFTLKSAFIDPLGPALSIPAAGGIAGALGWLVSYPLDCVKSNIMVAGRGRMLAVGLAILREKGVGGMYAGLAPSLARSFLVSGTRFSAYEGGREAWRKRNGGEGLKVG